MEWEIKAMELVHATKEKQSCSCWLRKASYLWYAVLVNNLPNIPVFFPGSLPEFEGSYKGIFIRQTLWKYIPGMGREKESNVSGLAVKSRTSKTICISQQHFTKVSHSSYKTRCIWQPVERWTWAYALQVVLSLRSPFLEQPWSFQIQ